MQVYGKGIKRKMCKKLVKEMRKEEQKFSKCMICLDVNESLEKVALNKKSSYSLENTQEFKKGCGPKVKCI
jgi:hypothetical protein